MPIPIDRDLRRRLIAHLVATGVPNFCTPQNVSLPPAAIASAAYASATVAAERAVDAMTIEQLTVVEMAMNERAAVNSFSDYNPYAR